VKLKIRRDNNLLNYFSQLNIYYLFFGVLILDQLSKYLFGRFLSTVCNSGVAFGLRGGGTLFSTFILLTVLLLMRMEKNRGSLAALALVFAGGFSNLVDRILFGCVRDFIDFVIFPVFNFADVFISLGVALVIYFTMMRKNETV